MAQISGNIDEKVFPIKAFLGLNENPDGDTKLKMGEAAVVRNFRITRDKNLQRRPGTKTVLDLETGKPIKGLWDGFINGHEYLLGASDGKLYKLWDDTQDDLSATEIGSVNTDDDVHIFGFSDIAYIMDGHSYKQYDGTTLSDVVGYRPLVTISVPPAGGGETLENVNRLNGMRRMWISTTGTDATYVLPEKNITSIDYVKNLATGENLPATDYTVDLTVASVTFNTAPAQATNGYEIGWTVPTTFRSQVTALRYSELYSGRQDARVFIYGDGSNKCFYSGIDYNGDPRADYFPDLYEIAVGDENTPITAMIRHYFSLMCYKSTSAWMIEATNYTLADSSTIPAFWVVPINRSIGNAALGQVRLVLNSPYTLFGNDLYEWKNNASYASNLNVDERQAKRISDRVWATIKTFDVEKCYCFDDNDAQEYYICYDGKALIYNYAADAWSYYTQFPVSCMTFLQKELFIGSPDGKLKRVSYEYLNDDGQAIDAYWESGSLGFGKDFMRKYAAMLWIGIKPESNSEVWVTVQTDRNSKLQEKVVESALATFTKANFARWSFDTNRKPHMTRLKIKAKKFVFYKLIFESSSADTRATILVADIRVRMTGYAK